MLPDHPEIAPESVNDFFDGTEIEEALVLHIQALSDQEREEISAQDPKVREMLARADATTPQQLMDLHGRVRIEDPPGEREVTFDGVTYRRGQKVILHPPQDADVYDKMLDGRTRDDPPPVPARRTIACTSASPSTTIRCRRSSARAGASCSSSPKRSRWSS